MAQFEQILARLDREALRDVVCEKAHGLIPYFSDARVVRNGCVVLLLCFKESTKRWAVRIPQDQEHAFLFEIAGAMQYVAREFPALPVARVHGFWEPGKSDKMNVNPVGVSCLLVDWIEGKPLAPWSIANPPMARKKVVLEQIADIMLEMLLRPAGKGIRYYGEAADHGFRDFADWIGVPDGTPCDTGVSTTVWLTESVDRGIRRSLRQRNCSNTIDYLIQRSMISKHVVGKLENSPWVVIHPDLYQGNIIADSEDKISGLIDWDLTFATPLQAAASFPKFLETPPGGAPAGLGEEYAYLDLADEKACFVEMMREKEKRRLAVI